MQAESYEKPIIASQASAYGILPLAAVATAEAAAALATAVGMGLGLAMGNNKGRSDVFPLGHLRTLQEA